MSRRLIDVNVCTRDLRATKRLLVYGKCVEEEYPSIFSKYSEGRVALSVCLEAEHMNTVGFKLASIVARIDLEEIVILTVDGSPHCIQLHFMAEEVNKMFGGKLPTKHLVIEEGKVVEVSPRVVKTARYLTKVKKLLLRINEST
ncbi:MAG: 4Fe-4S ferredoxin [Thermoprotei archaeon]|nr:MAG: 4Fe-4S ferredoxin [Thermoprotei archaeon]RLF01185.1 MAG: 4Fe-4S ferredoxin [Thermoprotei archaeon]